MHVHIAPTCTATHVMSIVAIIVLYTPCTCTHTIVYTLEMRTHISQSERATVTNTPNLSLSLTLSHTHSPAQLLNYFCPPLYSTPTKAYRHTHKDKGKECAKFHQLASQWVNTPHTRPPLGVNWPTSDRPSPCPFSRRTHTNNKGPSWHACTWRWWHVVNSV